MFSTKLHIYDIELKQHRWYVVCTKSHIYVAESLDHIYVCFKKIQKINVFSTKLN